MLLLSAEFAGVRVAWLSVWACPTAEPRTNIGVSLLTERRQESWCGANSYLPYFLWLKV